MITFGLSIEAEKEGVLVWRIGGGLGGRIMGLGWIQFMLGKEGAQKNFVAC